MESWLYTLPKQSAVVCLASLLAVALTKEKYKRPSPLIPGQEISKVLFSICKLLLASEYSKLNKIVACLLL